MSLSPDLNKHIYVGNGTTTTFDYTFDVLAEDDLHVFLIEVSTGAETEVTSNFTVTPSEGGYPSSNGTVIYPTIGTAITSEYNLAILRTLDILQPTIYPNNTALKPKVVEKSFDRITMIAQQLQEQVDRCVKTSLSGSTDVDLDLLGEYADQAILSAANASVSENNASASEVNAANSAASAATSAANAFAATAPAWDSGTTYNYPDVVAYTDGNSYRCIGYNILADNPSDSINWVRITINTSDFFEIDENGDLMPSLTPTYSSSFELDENGDIMPQE